MSEFSGSRKGNQLAHLSRKGDLLTRYWEFSECPGAENKERSLSSPADAHMAQLSGSSRASPLRSPCSTPASLPGTLGPLPSSSHPWGKTHRERNSSRKDRNGTNTHYFYLLLPNVSTHPCKVCMHSHGIIT